jgi:hypothetical protein
MSTPAPTLSPPPPPESTDGSTVVDAHSDSQNVPLSISAHESASLSLKRSYLELLPHSQLAELCLALDGHVPAPARADIWPADLPAAIGALVASGHTPNSSRLPAPGQVAPPVSILPTATPAAAALAVPGPSKGALGALGPYASNGSYTRPNAGYPHYSSGGGAAGSSTNYPKPALYPATERTAIKRAADGAPAPGAKLTPDEMPSYEEMLVEALEACGDPAGAPPKVLFQWMEATYPLHSNFRPSASQALQKAFKRGRLNKSESGKYSVNASWEGSTVSSSVRAPFWDLMQ